MKTASFNLKLDCHIVLENIKGM